MSASSDVDSYHLGAYASWRPGAWGLLLGTAHSWHDGKVKRSVAYEGASDELKGRFSGDTQQFFAETSYRRFLGETTVFEPYAGLAYVSQHTHRKRERRRRRSRTVAAGRMRRCPRWDCAARPAWTWAGPGS